MNTPENPACPADGRDAALAWLVMYRGKPVGYATHATVDDVRLGEGETLLPVAALATPAAAPAARDAELPSMPESRPLNRGRLSSVAYGYTADDMRAYARAALQAAASTQAGAREVQAEIVAQVRNHADGEMTVDWLLEGGIDAVGEDGDCFLYVLNIAPPEDGHVTLYTADAIGGSATQDVVPVARLRELSAKWRGLAEERGTDDEPGLGGHARLMLSDLADELDAITTERSATPE